MKRVRAIGVALLIAAVSVTPFLIPHHEADAQNSSYYNWNQLGTLDEQYAYAKIYRTADTRITAKKYDLSRGTTDEEQVGNSEYVVNTANGQVVILLENTTAADANGNKVDVIFRLKNFRSWSGYGSSNQEAFIYFRSTICGTSETVTTDNMGSLCTGANSDRKKTLGVDDPIMFWVETRAADIDFVVEYIQKGSYNESTTKGTPVPSIDRLAFASFDYDVLRWGSESDGELFGGDEGITLTDMNPTGTKTTFYYQKNNKLSDFNLREGNNGIAINANDVGNDFNGIYYANSAIGVVTGVENSTYAFRYSARWAGITVFFGSPIKYDTPAPKKYVVASNKTTCDSGNCLANNATTGDTFNYIISQDVPNRYSSDVDILTFMSLWSRYPNIASDHFYTSFTISDTIDENLTMAAGGSIKVYNRANQDVTNMFTTSYANGRITVTAKPEYLTNKAFYDNTFRVVFPVKVNSTVTKGTLKNTAKTTFKQTGDPDDTEKDSNEVSTGITHKVTVTHISNATGEILAGPDTNIYNHGASYRTSPLDVIPTDYTLDELNLPTNASGTVTRDIEVVYYYDLHHKVITRHISIASGEEIADPTTDSYIHNAHYDTEPLKGEKLPEGFSLHGYPENASGTVDRDIEVLYYYDPNYVLIVRHVSTATNKDLVEPVSTVYRLYDEYETSVLKELPKGYKPNEKLPENAKGTITGNIEVVYYYDPYCTVTTRHISKQTGAEISDPVFEEVICKSEYETEPAEDLPEGYVLTEVPENAAGVADKDIEVVYIYDIPPAPKTFDSDPAPFAAAFAGVGALIAGAVFFLTRRR